MKKGLVILIFLFSFLYGDDNYQLKLYEKIIPTIFQQQNLFVYTDESSKNLIQKSEIFQLSSNCRDATLLIGDDFSQLDTQCLNKPVFSISYRGFKNSPNSFGAFYWRKGRPQIKFKLDIIKKFNLYLPLNMLKYAQ